MHAAEHLREFHAAPAVLIGHSLGGTAVLAAAGETPEVRAVATVGAPSGTDHVLHLLGEHREEIARDGEAEVLLAGCPFRIRKQFLDDVTSQPLTARIQKLDAALLVMHSPSDEIVEVDNARDIFDAARHPRSFVSLDGADHLLTRPADSRFAASVLAAWASRYLHDAPPRPSAPYSTRAGGRGGRQGRRGRRARDDAGAGALGPHRRRGRPVVGLEGYRNVEGRARGLRHDRRRHTAALVAADGAIDGLASPLRRPRLLRIPPGRLRGPDHPGRGGASA